MNAVRRTLAIWAAGFVTALMVASPAITAELFGLKIGDPISEASTLGLKLTNEQIDGPLLFQKFATPSGNNLSITAMRANSEIVYIQVDWNGNLSGRLTDVPDLKFGSSTLTDLREKFGSNGFARTAHMAFMDGDRMVSFNSFGLLPTGEQSLTFLTAISADEFLRTQDQGKAELIAIVLASEAFLDDLWGSEKLFDTTYQLISTNQPKRVPAVLPDFLLGEWETDSANCGSNQSASGSGMAFIQDGAAATFDFVNHETEGGSCVVDEVDTVAGRISARCRIEEGDLTDPTIFEFDLSRDESSMTFGVGKETTQFARCSTTPARWEFVKGQEDWGEFCWVSVKVEDAEIGFGATPKQPVMAFVQLPYYGVQAGFFSRWDVDGLAGELMAGEISDYFGFPTFDIPDAAIFNRIAAGRRMNLNITGSPVIEVPLDGSAGAISGFLACIGAR